MRILFCSLLISTARSIAFWVTVRFIAVRKESNNEANKKREQIGLSILNVIQDSVECLQRFHVNRSSVSLELVVQVSLEPNRYEEQKAHERQHCYENHEANQGVDFDPVDVVHLEYEDKVLRHANEVYDHEHVDKEDDVVVTVVNCLNNSCSILKRMEDPRQVE